MTDAVARAAEITLRIIDNAKHGVSLYANGPLTEDEMRALASAYSAAMPPRPLADHVGLKYLTGEDPLPLLTDYVAVVFAAGFSAGARWAASEGQPDPGTST